MAHKIYIKVSMVSTISSTMLEMLRLLMFALTANDDCDEFDFYLSSPKRAASSWYWTHSKSHDAASMSRAKCELATIINHSEKKYIYLYPQISPSKSLASPQFLNQAEIFGACSTTHIDASSLWPQDLQCWSSQACQLLTSLMRHRHAWEEWSNLWPTRGFGLLD